jgi:hypothetical protein
MKLILLLTALLASISAFSQIDSAFILKLKALDTANILKTDTVPVPNDSFTQKIKQLLGEKNGLTVGAILRIKIMDEQQKDTVHSKEFYKKLIEDITTGKTSRLLENSIINIYRRTFTESEIDQLISFFKTSAGKKMDKEFLLLLVQSVKDGEQLLNLAVKDLEKNK